MQLNIKPQDRTQPETLELELHPALIRRLKTYADSLGGSDLNYVASQIFDQVLPPENGSKKAARNLIPRVGKLIEKETAKKPEASHAARG